MLRKWNCKSNLQLGSVLHPPGSVFDMDADTFEAQDEEIRNKLVLVDDSDVRVDPVGDDTSPVFPDLNSRKTCTAVNECSDVDKLQDWFQFEAQAKDRSGVKDAIVARIAELADPDESVEG